MNREVRALGYRKLSARPRNHAQAEGTIEAFKKACPHAWKVRIPVPTFSICELLLIRFDQLR